MVGPPSSPTALVPSGPLIDHSDVYGRSPGRGALVPIPLAPQPNTGFTMNGGSYVRPRSGVPSVYNPPAPGQGIPLGPLPPEGPGPRQPVNWPSPAHLAQGAVAVYYGGEMLAGAVAAALRPSLDLQQASVQIAAQTGMSDGDVKGVINLARTLQRTIPGTNVQGNLEVYRQLFTLTQDSREATTLLPAFLPTGVALNSYGPQAGTYDEQLEGVMKSAEFRGAINKVDPKTGATSVDATGAIGIARQLLAFETVSKGAIDPNTYLAFLRSAGTSGANMDSSQTAGMIAIIQAMGARRAGQALQSFEQQFTSGKMSQGVLEMLTEMGIVKNPNLVRKIGMGQFMLMPHAMNEKDVSQAAIYPMDFFRQVLLPATDKYLAKNFGKSFTDADPKHRLIQEASTLQTLASRMPGGVLMGEWLRNMALSARDTSATKAAGGRNLVGILNDSPITKINAFTGALNDLIGEFGTPAFNSAMGGMTALTHGLNALVQAGQKENVATGVGTAAGHAAEVGGGLAVIYAAGKIATKVGLSGVGPRLVAGAKFGTKLGAAGIAAELIASSVDAASPNGNFGSWIDRNVPGAGWLDRFAYRHINPYTAPLGFPFGQDNMAPSAPRATAPTGPAPGSKGNPAHVIMDNARDLATGVTSHLAKQAQRPPTGPNFGNPSQTPIYPGMMGSGP